ncbi:AMP-binding protein [Pendulispora brunnea]|uniref:AMP-binding protein n=1 Tax=Pendulispora brunnea TaxID=2905690 RepID=A0ABZ2K183_9BACT
MTFAMPSIAQQRFWAMHQTRLHAGSLATPLVVELRGPLDRKSLERAVHALVIRHEMLRVLFESSNGLPRRCGPECVRVELELADGANRSRDAVEAWVRDTISRPLRLDRAPILRAALLQLRDDEHLLVLVSHRAVVDARSMRLLFDDLTTNYAAFVCGERPIFAEPAISESRPGDEAMHDLGPRLTELLGANYAVAPPADFPLPSDDAARRCRSFPLNRDQLMGLADLFIEDGPVQVVLMAAYAQVLARFSGDYDLTLARPHRRQGSVGPFESSAVLRVNMTDNPPFRQLVRRLQTSTARPHVPVEALLVELRPLDTLEDGPIARAAFDFADAHPSPVERAGLCMTVRDIAQSCAEYPFVLRLRPRGTGHVVDLDYRAHSFSAQLIDSFLDAYRALLVRIAEYPDGRVQDVPLLPLRHTFPSVTPAARKYPSVCELVDRAIAAAPNAPALVKGERSWSYGDLARLAGETAEKLRSLGHRPGETVAICPTARGFELYAALLGAWQAGGIIMMVNSALPPAQRTSMLERARARTLLIAGDELPSWWSAVPTANVVVLAPDRGWSILREKRSPALPLSQEPAAYVFFTSGTTGTPKALLGRHDSLSHFVLWQRDEFAVERGDQCAQLTSLFTDAVLRDIFTPLISGACLHVPPGRALYSDEPAMLGWLGRSRVTFAHTMPSLSSLWLGRRADDVHATLNDLRLLFFSGEPLTGALVERWHAMAPHAELVNLYGTSECTMIQAFHRVQRNARELLQPAGKGIPDADIFALTPSGTPCGPGEVGQVHIRTPYATLDYAGRIFRTEDRARVRRDGSLEVFGRAEGRARIRGIDVDLEQVSALLARQAGVRTSAVMRLADGAGDAHLVAFVVLDAPTSAHELRCQLSKLLPAAAVPSHVVFLHQLPVTAVGKLDRHQLKKENSHVLSNPTPS